MPNPQYLQRPAGLAQPFPVHGQAQAYAAASRPLAQCIHHWTHSRPRPGAGAYSTLFLLRGMPHCQMLQGLQASCLARISHTSFLILAIHSLQALQACKYLRRGWMQAQACTGVLRGTKRLNLPSKPVWLYMQARLGLTCHTKVLHWWFMDKAILVSTLSRQEQKSPGQGIHLTWQCVYAMQKSVHAHRPSVNAASVYSPEHAPAVFPIQNGVYEPSARTRR